MILSRSFLRTIIVDHVGMLDFLSKRLEVYGHWLNERWIHPTDAFFQEQEKFFARNFLIMVYHRNIFRSRSIIKQTMKYSCNRSLTGQLVEGMNPPGLSEWTSY